MLAKTNSLAVFGQGHGVLLSLACRYRLVFKYKNEGTKQGLLQVERLHTRGVLLCCCNGWHCVVPSYLQQTFFLKQPP